MLLYLRTVLISAHSVMILMIPLSAFYAVLKGTSCKNVVYRIVNAQRSFPVFWGEICLSLYPLCFALSDFCLSSLFSPSSISCCFHSPRVVSIVRRLHPGQLRHHPVTWLSGLLPTQPELHVDNRDLPWQRLAEKLRVNTCSSQIQFPLTMSFPPTEWPFDFAEQAVSVRTGR